ncbi:MAG: 16S rRNA (guanine(527)-N(7))-methyltransferase RsmG, partial [Sutterellaceae bacterium]|nr:16S rRNA (guanine(527)-N(7))-methyltransferase RsmG [Sutterellaceae bacterium]
MDSLSLVKNLDAVPTDIKRVLDVGSGGGLPAIPLAVMRPELSVSMVDAVQKKIIFLRQCIAVCRLPNAKAFHARIEKLDEEPFDVITSRAFASLSDMVSLTRNLLKPTGYWLAMKGRYPEDEIQALPDDI